MNRNMVTKFICNSKICRLNNTERKKGKLCKACLAFEKRHKTKLV